VGRLAVGFALERKNGRSREGLKGGQKTVDCGDSPTSLYFKGEGKREVMGEREKERIEMLRTRTLVGSGMKQSDSLIQEEESHTRGSVRGRRYHII